MKRNKKRRQFADPAKLMARLTKKGMSANSRRHLRTIAERERLHRLFCGAMQVLGYVLSYEETQSIVPLTHLQDGSCTFKEVYACVTALIGTQEAAGPSTKAFGAWLRTLSLETHAGRIGHTVHETQIGLAA